MTARIPRHLALLNLVEGALRNPAASVQARVSAALGYAEQLSLALHDLKTPPPISGEEIEMAFEWCRDLSENWFGGVGTPDAMADFLNARGLVAERRGEEQAGTVRVVSSPSTSRGDKPVEIPSTIRLCLNCGAEMFTGQAQCVTCGLIPFQLPPEGATNILKNVIQGLDGAPISEEHQAGVRERLKVALGKLEAAKDCLR